MNISKTPWTFAGVREGDTCRVLMSKRDGGVAVAMVFGDDAEQRDNNARMMAASPKLHAALLKARRIVALVAAGSKSLEDAAILKEIDDAIRAVKVED